MFGRFKKKGRIASIELSDFYIRALVFTEGDLSTALLYEAPLPQGLVVEEVVQDEMVFYEILKELVKEWGIAKVDLRFFVPDHAVLMRLFQYPEALAPTKLKEYVEMEIGQSIHLPFKEPLIDVYKINQQEGEAILFAAPSEDIVMLMGLYEDVKLEPTHLGVRALSNLRFLGDAKFLADKRTYLIVDWSVQAASMSIYSNENVDFLRYQPIESAASDWRYIQDANGDYRYVYEGEIENYQGLLTEQIHEIERILNFYRFSLHKGEKSVDEIVMMGDHPEISFIVSEMSRMIDLQISVIDDAFVEAYAPSCGAKHAALIGLSLKGVNLHDS